MPGCPDVRVCGPTGDYNSSMTPINPAARKNWPRYVVLACVIAGCAAGVVYFKELREEGKEWLLSLRAQSTWGPLLVGLTYLPLSVFALPTWWITVLAGYTFGLARTFIAVWIGSSLGATCAFLLGRYLGRDWIVRRLAKFPRLSALDQAFEDQGWKIVLLARLSPLIPFNILNYASGVSRLSLKGYVLATTLGMIPGILLFTQLGVLLNLSIPLEEQITLKNPAVLYFSGFGLVMTFVATWWLGRLAKRVLDKQQEEKMPGGQGPVV